MTAFGIILRELGSNVEHYVGEDTVLWDWLQEDNYELAASGNLYRVKAPVGYLFHFQSLFPMEGYDGGKDSELVALGSTAERKALMLLVSLRFVSSEEFGELDIDEDRIMDIVIN